MQHSNYSTPQGISSTFHPPLLDGSVSILNLFHHHSVHSANHPVWRYHDGVTHNICWREASHAFNVAARHIQAHVKLERKTSDKLAVVAILASIDSISYFVLILGIMCAGFVPFPISTRNSASAIAHLLSTTACQYLLVSSDHANQKRAAAAYDLLSTDSKFTILSIPKFDDLFGLTSNGAYTVAQFPEVDQDQPAIILHTSGTSTFPKFITITFRSVLQQGLLPFYGDVDICGQVLSTQAVPMFHVMGIIPMWWTATAGIILGVFPPKGNPAIPTPKTVFDHAILTGCDILYCVPTFLESWAVDPSYLESLSKFNKVYFGGGPLQSSIGDILAEKGVKLTPLYGSTEAGAIVRFIDGGGGGPWEYFTISRHLSPVFLPVDGEDKLFRLIVKSCNTHRPSIINTSVDGVEAYDTGDLLSRHPSIDHLYKFAGRYDDQIIHSTGEKTNPVPIENLLHNDPKIASAIVFGSSKFHAGVLIMPSQEHVFDPTDLKLLAEYRNSIWSTVQKANQHVPQHSRIFKEMIVITHPSKPIEVTAKGTAKRRPTLETYKAEIEEAYRAAKESSQPEILRPQSWELDETTAFIRQVIHGVMGPDVRDTDNLFDIGGDSLSATWIRNTVLRAIRDSDLIPLAIVRGISPEFAFSFPSIATLSAFVYGVVLAGRAHKGPITSISDSKAMDTPKDGPTEAPAVPSDDDDPTGDMFAIPPPLRPVGQCIIKLRPGDGEAPLIILHAGNGKVDAYGPLQEHFRSALWAIQVTPDTPVTSLRRQIAFYFHKIKEEQPHGPYRLAGFSGSSIIAYGLCEMFQKNGDEVVQLAMLDHYPLLYLCPVVGMDMEHFNPADHAERQVLLTNCMRNIYEMLCRDGGGVMRVPAQGILDAFNGLPASTFAKDTATMTVTLYNAVLDFIVELADEQPPSTDTGSPDPGLNQKTEGYRWLGYLERWLKTIKAPLTIYIASEGVSADLPPEHREEWADFGAHRCFPDARVLRFNGGHSWILADRELIRCLENY